MDELTHKNSSTQTVLGLNGQESFSHRLYDSALIIDKYYTPLLFLFGTVGNSLSLAVFCLNPKYRNQSASFYLSALSVSDTGYLLNLLAVWLEGVYGGVITSGVMCPLVMYLGQVTCFMSVYLTVAFSIERYIAVHYPLSRPRICTRSKAKKVIAALTAVAVLVFSYAWIIAQVIELPPSTGYYDDVYQDNLTMTTNVNSVNMSQETISVQRKGLNSIDPYLDRNDNFAKVQNCFNASHGGVQTMESIHSQNEQSNCSRSLIGQPEKLIPNGLEGPLYSGESSEEFPSSLPAATDSVENDDNNGESDEQFISGGYICSVPKDYYRISEIANYLDSVVTLIIPFFLITFFNVQIAICVWKLKDQRQNIVATSADINHHHGLRCATAKSSIYREKISKKKQGSSGGARKKQQFITLEACEENGIRRTDENNANFQAVCCRRQRGKGVEERMEDEYGGLRDKRGAKSTSPSTDGSTNGSEEDSLVDNCGYHDDCGSEEAKHHFHQTRSCETRNHDDHDSHFNLGLNAPGKDEMSLSTNKACPKSLLDRPAPLSKFSGCRAIQRKWKQKQNLVPTRVSSNSNNPQFPVVLRERTPHPPAATSSVTSSSSNASEVRVTKTLLLVSTIFVVLNLPAHAVRCARFIQTLRGTSEGHEFLFAAQLWSNILFNTNFAVNFLLYCASGRNFRQSLKNLILRKRDYHTSRSWKEPGGRKKFTGAQQRNCTRELHVTEVVELELEERNKVPSCRRHCRIDSPIGHSDQDHGLPECRGQTEDTVMAV